MFDCATNDHIGPERAQALLLENDLAPYDRHPHLNLADFRRWNARQVPVEEHKIGQLALLECALSLFRKLSVGGIDGVGAQSFVDRDLLLRNPATRIPVSQTDSRSSGALTTRYLAAVWRSRLALLRFTLKSSAAA